MKIKLVIPFIILFCLLTLLGRELFFAKTQVLSSPLIGQPVPHFKLPNILEKQKTFTQEDLIGHVSLLTIWATWCYACQLEHPFLVKINEKYHISIYSIIYRDNVKKAQQWIEENGNPFVKVGNDAKGDVAIDFGVYGTPETYVINAQGKIIYRHIGIIDQKSWETLLYPLLKKNGVA